jgi:hypothetical protein
VSDTGEDGISFGFEPLHHLPIFARVIAFTAIGELPADESRFRRRGPIAHFHPPGPQQLAWLQTSRGRVGDLGEGSSRNSKPGLRRSAAEEAWQRMTDEWALVRPGVSNREIRAGRYHACNTPLAIKGKKRSPTPFARTCRFLSILYRYEIIDASSSEVVQVRFRMRKRDDSPKKT